MFDLCHLITVGMEQFVYPTGISLDKLGSKDIYIYAVDSEAFRNRRTVTKCLFVSTHNLHHTVAKHNFRLITTGDISRHDISTPQSCGSPLLYFCPVLNNPPINPHLPVLAHSWLIVQWCLAGVYSTYGWWTTTKKQHSCASGRKELLLRSTGNQTSSWVMTCKHQSHLVSFLISPFWLKSCRYFNHTANKSFTPTPCIPTAMHWLMHLSEDCLCPFYRGCSY